MKRIVTQEDLDLNPELIDQGVEVGDEIEIPETNEPEGEVAGDGPGGTNPPGNPPTNPPKP